MKLDLTREEGEWEEGEALASAQREIDDLRAALERCRADAAALRAEGAELTEALEEARAEVKRLRDEIRGVELFEHGQDWHDEQECPFCGLTGSPLGRSRHAPGCIWVEVRRG